MADHVLGNGHVVVDLAVVDLEREADEVGKDGGGACLGADRGRVLALLNLGESETVEGAKLLLIHSVYRGPDRGEKERGGRVVRHNVRAWREKRRVSKPLADDEQWQRAEGCAHLSRPTA